MQLHHIPNIKLFQLAVFEATARKYISFPSSGEERQPSSPHKIDKVDNLQRLLNLPIFFGRLSNRLVNYMRALNAAHSKALKTIPFNLGNVGHGHFTNKLQRQVIQAPQFSPSAYMDIDNSSIEIASKEIRDPGKCQLPVNVNYSSFQSGKTGKTYKINTKNRKYIYIYIHIII